MVFGYAFTKYHLILSLRVQHFETYKSYKYLKFAFENVSRTTPRVKKSIPMRIERVDKICAMAVAFLYCGRH